MSAVSPGWRRRLRGAGGGGLVVGYSVLDPVGEVVDAGVDPGEAGPGAAVASGDDAVEQPLVILVAHHGAARVILQRHQ